ncbi:MAG: hypothetical protein ABL901_03595 [Hyphomicrobiaceae bacterium]
MPIDSTTQSSTAPRKGARAVALPVACGLGMAVIALIFTTFNSEKVVATGFERAFAALQKPTVNAVGRAYDGIAGTEEFWLQPIKNGNLVKAVAVGQQITVAANGTERRLTITNIDEAGDAMTHIQTSASRALLVTCREGDATTGRVIRFRLDANQFTELPAGAITTQRTL